MSRAIQNILKKPNIPIMSDDGLYALANYIFEGKWEGIERGPSRRLQLDGFTPFTMEKPLSHEDFISLEHKIFKLVVTAMREDMNHNPDFLSDLYSKNKSYSKFTEGDFLEVIRLVENDQIVEAISTELGSFIFENNCEFAQDHIGSIDNLPLTNDNEIPDEKDYIRIYINTSNGENAARFLYEYISRCIEQGMPYDMKGLNHASQDRTDGTVLYVPIKYLDKSIDILKGMDPELVKTFGTPLASAHNEDYFAVCRNPGTQTYNLFFDDMAYITFVKSTATLILDKYRDQLDAEQVRMLEEFSDKRAFINDVGVKGSIKSRLSKLIRGFGPYIQEVMSSHKTELVQTMREQMQEYSSTINYGDEDHKEFPVCFDKKIYTYFGVEALEIPKIQVSQERYLDLLRADKSRIRFELAKMGMRSEIQGKTEKELRTMLFDRIELDDDSIINILSGGSKELKEFVDAMGVDDEYEHRYEYEERFIEIIGVDRVIDAAESVADRDAELGRNRRWRFKDSLYTVRMSRGESIYNSEEFQALDTKEERNEYMKNFPAHAKDDVQRYYDYYVKGKTISS